MWKRREGDWKDDPYGKVRTDDISLFCDLGIINLAAYLGCPFFYGLVAQKIP